MPANSPRTSQAAALPTAFQRHLLTALEKFHQVEWLGDHSPLSAPYFLGRPVTAARGPASISTALQRGQTLQRILRQTNDWLAAQGQDAQAISRLIQLAYFQATPLTADEVGNRLGLSRATYFRRREQALAEYAAAFIRQINPALRLDRPPQPDRLVGRDPVYADCLRALQQNRSVGLSGPAGIGKTALGATLVTSDQLAPRKVFWFTIVPGLNDHLGSLLAALGYFLWQQSAAHLWGQLIADQGRLNLAVLQALLYQDLADLREVPPVLCFDEVDLLRPAEVEAHARFAAFLETLRGAHACPCLFIGQRPLIEVDEQVTLDGLTATDLAQWLDGARSPLTPADLDQLAQHTNGNPRLIDLFVSLQRAGEPIELVVARLDASPSIESLVNRLWPHLEQAEQQLLYELTPFRRPAPADAWPPAVCARLLDRRLIERNQQGGIALSPALRAVLADQLPAEARRGVRLHAANIRAARAEYTAALYHCLQAGEPHLAVWLWHLHSREEIQQGQGQTALALFEQLDPDSLETADRDILALTLAELRKLNGDDPRPGLRQTVWQSAALKLLGQRLEGDVAELKGQLDEAVTAYQAGLESTDNLLAERALFDKNLAWTHIRQGGEHGLEMAWQKASLARFEAERLQGDIKWRQGDFLQAETYYTQALALAEALGYLDGQAKTHNHLATLYARQSKLDEAKHHRTHAITLFEQIGNQVHLAGARLNMAFDHNLIGQRLAIQPPADEALRPIFEQAVDTATAALKLFETLGQTHGQIIAAQNLAEAHLYLDELASAEKYARQVIDAQIASILSDGLRTLGEVHLAQGNLIDAEARIREALAAAQSNHDHYLEAYGQRALMRLRLMQHQIEEARSAQEQAEALFESLDLPQEIERTHLAWGKSASQSIGHGSTD
ncbi:MAG: ATP-binding protein [Chloroflexi bacterium]|nr:ATP-binding protein [Chloroflexota bacterium]